MPTVSPERMNRWQLLLRLAEHVITGAFREWAVELDKQRANLMATIGWRILHFTSSRLYGEMPNTLGMVRDVINHYGGLQDPNADGGYRYTHGPDDGQPRLFG